MKGQVLCDCLQVAKSRLFRREGADVHSDVTISLTQAILGGTIRIPGIYSDILLTVSHLVISRKQFLCLGKLRAISVCLTFCLCLSPSLTLSLSLSLSPPQPQVSF